MRYRISHTTTYEYTEPVSLCQNLAHLTPRGVANQVCRHSALSIDPEAAIFSNRLDYFGNWATFFAVQEPHRQLTILASHVVEVTAPNVPEPDETPAWESAAEALRSSLDGDVLEASQFVYDSRYAPAGAPFADYARPSFAAGRPLLAAVLDLTGRIHRDFVYDPASTTVATTLAEMFAQKRGVCQDFAHFQIACLRSLGLAARYVSGYLCTDPAPGAVPLQGVDATHAWVSVFCPGAGWIAVDPTNDRLAEERHIVLAWGRDFDDVSPIKGIVLGGGQHGVHVGVDVTQNDEP